MNARIKLPVHPGEVLCDWINGKRISIADAASTLCFSVAELKLVLSGKVPLSPTLAVRLEEIGWGTAERWSGTQIVWDIAQVRKQLDLPDKPITHYTDHTLDFGFNVYHKRVNGLPRPAYRPPCANIVIASSGTEEASLYQTKYGEIRSRAGALLKYTKRDAESMYRLWKKKEINFPDELQVLLIDPSTNEVEDALRSISTRIREAHPKDIGLDLFFAGHGEPGTGNLILKDGKLSPVRFLELQANDVCPNSGVRTIGVFLDSCYSGAFLLRLAIESFENFKGFRLDNGLASCLPDEQCAEMDLLEHGVFTYTRLNTGNSYIDQQCFNQAIVDGDFDEIVKGLQGMVGMVSNPSAFITEGKQFSMSLMKHVVTVEGGFATVELGENTDFDKISRQITRFKQARHTSK